MKLSQLVENINTVTEEAKETVKKVYLENNKPWIIGYSGGKDSTATLHVVLESLLELPKEQLKNHIYVITSDTLVETPLIINEISVTLGLIQQLAEDQGLPLSTHKVRPQTDETFWVNLIGKGYPSPNQTFRWCTDRMKINPTNKFITDVVSECGEVIVVLGVRSGESNSRDRVLNKRSIENSELMKHSTLQNAYVFPAIINFTIDDVWNLLLNSKSPWNGDNTRLFRLYSESSDASECPLVIDKSTKDSAGSCGNSRFGCWVCTVVKEDKSLSGFINSGYEWLKPLREYRDWLVEIRDHREYRMKIRINGQIYFAKVQDNEESIIIPAKVGRPKLLISKATGIDQNGEFWNILENREAAISFIKEHNVDLKSSYDPKIIIKTNEGYNILGTGGFTHDARKEMLKRLLVLEKHLKETQSTEIELISKIELLEIQKLWHNQGYWNNDVVSIYYEIYNQRIDLIVENQQVLDFNDLSLLERICEEHNVDFGLVKKLILIETENFGLKRRDTVLKELRKILSQDYFAM